MKYKELLDLGFKRNNELESDNNFFNQYGYSCFWLEYTLYKKGNGDDPEVDLFIEWEPTELKYCLVVHEKLDVASRKEITEDEAKVLININKRDKGYFEVDNPGFFTA